MKRLVGPRALCAALCFLLALTSAGLPLCAQTQPPLHYYDAAIGQTGLALKSALKGIIRGHTVIPYTSSTRTDTWTALKTLDEAAADPSRVVLIYSGFLALKSAQWNGQTGEWEREHLWPQSYGLTALDAESRARTDLFNLRAINPSVNGSRSNKYYDYSTAPISTHPLAPGCTADTNSWEPREVEKGAIARSMFYMAVRYDGSDVDVPDLELSDTPNAATATFGKLSTLLLWHRLLGVTDAELTRNQQIDSFYQHNRNPFIDHPEWAEMVFHGVTPWQGWQSTRFTAAEAANPAISGDLADPDGDGLNNRLEYFYQRDPRMPEPVPPAIMRVTRQGNTQSLTITYVHNRFATDTTVTYERSTDLQTWTAANPGGLTTTALDFETEQIAATFATNGPQLFVRVRVNRTGS